jgi:hypothetical protein
MAAKKVPAGKTMKGSRGAATPAKKSTAATGRKSPAQKGAASKVMGAGRSGMRTGRGTRTK